MTCGILLGYYVERVTKLVTLSNLIKTIGYNLWYPIGILCKKSSTRNK